MMRLGMVIDQERCIGCEACTIACRIENNTPYFWIKVETQGGSEKDTPSGKFPELSINFLPKLCNHCEKPPCVESCPVEAIAKLNNGIVQIDQGECTGCEACLTACPYSAISFNKEKNIAEKCNLCSHRIKKGLEPFCVICCEGQAIHFGDFSDPNSKVSQLITQEVFQIISAKKTIPSIYYCPPKPKKRL